MKVIVNILYLTMLLSGCNIYDKPGEDICGLIEFRGSINNDVTKSFSYMGSGIISLIYAFNENCVNYTVGETPLTACSTGYGELATNNALRLPNGVYDFYSISSNSTTLPGINVYQGYTGNLENGQDYLWASAKQINLVNGRIIYLNYRHTACQIKITVIAGNNVENLTVNDILCTYPSGSGVTLDLSSGIISPAQFTESYSSIPGSGNTRTFIILPCVAPLDIIARLDASIDGQYIPGRSFHTKLDFDFEGGNQYDIALSLNTDNALTVTFNMNDWDTLSETITY